MLQFVIFLDVFFEGFDDLLNAFSALEHQPVVPLFAGFRGLVAGFSVGSTEDHSFWFLGVSHLFMRNESSARISPSY